MSCQLVLYPGGLMNLCMLPLVICSETITIFHGVSSVLCVIFLHSSCLPFWICLLQPGWLHGAQVNSLPWVLLFCSLIGSVRICVGEFPAFSSLASGYEMQFRA